MVKCSAVIENDIITIVSESGPLTGAELVEKTRMDVFVLWQTCRRIPSIRTRKAGRRYLRLDRNVDGYARLSPSIRREFLTYTFVGLDTQQEALYKKTQKLQDEIREISQAKREVARESIVSAVGGLPQRDVILEKACFLIAGDVVYDMSHMVPRPEKSTGEMVKGSDLDIVIVVEDDLDPSITDALDRTIHKRKHLVLVNDREEIDYLIKTISRVKEQLKFDAFSSMVACKILEEAELLYGSRLVCEEMKNLLLEHGIPRRLDELGRQAAAERELAETQLLKINPEIDRSEYLNLFYTRAEEDEIC